MTAKNQISHSSNNTASGAIASVREHPPQIFARSALCSSSCHTLRVQSHLNDIDIRYASTAIGSGETANSHAAVVPYLLQTKLALLIPAADTPHVIMASSGAFYVTEPSAVAPRRDDLSEETAWEPVTTMAQLDSVVEELGDKPALSWKATPEDEAFTSWTWAEYREQVRQFGKSLIAVGMDRFKSVNIMGFNSREWFVADLGCIAAGGLAAGVYTSSGPDAIQYQLKHSEAVVCVVGNPALLPRFTGVGDACPELKAIVMYNTVAEDITDEIRSAVGVDIHLWDDFMALGGEVEDAVLDERIAAQVPGNCCTLIYTSGTTGVPKAVMISHDNATWTARSLMQCLGGLTEDRQVSYLPLSHIAAQMLDLHGPMQNGMQVFFADPDALKGTLTTTLKAAKPTVFFGVPRVWEKLYAGLSRVPESVPFKHRHMAVGLGACRAAFVGAAPVSSEVLEFFKRIELPVLEVFGQSECTGPQTISTPASSPFGFQCKIGWTGVAMPGTEMKIVEGTEEVVYRGRHIMMGYMKNAEKSAEAIDEEGFLHSGDQGEIDSEGFLRITGRIKELIITAGGENIAPVPLEKAIKAALPCVSNAVVVGDRQRFLSVLLTLKTKPDATGQATGNELFAEALATSQEIGSAATTVEEAMSDYLWLEHLTAGIVEANKSAVSNAAKVKKWRLLARDFTVVGGELGPTLKLKRPVVHKKNAALIEEIYATAVAPPAATAAAPAAKAAAPPTAQSTGAGAAAGAGAGTSAARTSRAASGGGSSRRSSKVRVRASMVVRAGVASSPRRVFAPGREEAGDAAERENHRPP